MVDVNVYKNEDNNLSSLLWKLCWFVSSSSLMWNIYCKPKLRWSLVLGTFLRSSFVVISLLGSIQFHWDHGVVLTWIPLPLQIGHFNPVKLIIILYLHHKYVWDHGIYKVWFELKWCNNASPPQCWISIHTIWSYYIYPYLFIV